VKVFESAELKVGRAVPRRFRQANDVRTVYGLRLRGAICKVLLEQPPIELNACQICQICYRLDLNLWGRADYPSLRSVRWHLKHMRQESSLSKIP
jgi:hypothetical protein